MAKHRHFTVKGKPFFSIGGQLHNSSGYPLGGKGGRNREDTEYSFRSIRALGANTVAVPVCWDAFEPEEGRFDAAYIHRIIDNARAHEVHLVLLWFGTWKNGQMEYTPAWVKAAPDRFPRVMCRDGSATPVLTAHSEANRRQDCAAFCRLMQEIKDYDEERNTVIAVQVENEPGIFAGTRRDFGPDGERAFSQPVPRELIRFIAGWGKGALYEKWVQGGSRNEGSWTQVYGSLGAEACTAWGIASYINEIARAGKGIYDIFMYANVWTDRNGERGWSLGGLEYPCGGAVSKMLPLWYAACDSLDAVSPDIYETEPGLISRSQDCYANPEAGWPLYIPESGLSAANATMMVRAAGEKGSIGHHVFGVEGWVDEAGNLTETGEAVRRSFQILENAAPLLLGETASVGRYTFCQTPGQDGLYQELPGWKCRVSFAGAGTDFAGWVPMDYHHRGQGKPANYVPQSLEEETARGILFQINENEFYLTGHNVRLFFLPEMPEDGSLPPFCLNGQHQAHAIEYLKLEEGHFEDGLFVTDRIRSGDEARHGVWSQADCGVVHFVLNPAGMKL